MANINLYTTFLFKWEGGFADDPSDQGGPTFRGVTLGTLRQIGYDKDLDGETTPNDLRLITEQEVIDQVLKPLYWDRWQADKIRSQSLANLLVDWTWCSGAHGIIIPQKFLGVDPDGVVGPVTLNALNDSNSLDTFTQLVTRRRYFLYSICRSRPANYKFLKGWINRLNDLQYFPP